MHWLRQIRVWCIGLAFVGLAPGVCQAINLSPSAAKGVGEAYGFVLGQEFSLRRIAKEFPELAVRVELARASFRSAFPEIQSKLEATLASNMKKEAFTKMKGSLDAKMRETIGKQQVTREIANGFLDDVMRRSKGEIASPVLEYLLALCYEENPVLEFSNKYRQRFQTDGRGKSRGVEVKLQLPRSWKAMEGERPHIVQKWVSEAGTGLEYMLLDVRDTEPGYEPSQLEMEELISSGDVKEFVPAGARHLASGKFHAERRTGYWIHMDMSVERAGMEIFQEALMYQLFVRGKAISITCAAGGKPDDAKKTSAKFEKLRPLCQQVVNSLVLPQAY